MLFRSLCRAPVRTVVADAGFDSEANHRLARVELGVASFMPAAAGRPTDKPPRRDGSDGS